MKSFDMPRVSAVAAACAFVLAFSVGAAQAQVAKPYFEFKKPRIFDIPNDISTDTNGMSAPVMNLGGGYVLGFEAISQYDNAALGRNSIPPDTIGAVGLTQYMSTTNGGYAVFDKNTGARLSLTSDVAFWAAAGQTGTNGDTRIMYNAAASRWIAVAFGAATKDLQIAVSDADNALGTWKSVKFEGYAGLGFGATADYPTLALDRNAVYIGTNNFAPATSGGTNSFRGTTLNVIPLNSLFNATAPSLTNIKQFVTPYDATSTSNVDRGFAAQGVNSRTVGSSGSVVAASVFEFKELAFKVNGLSASSATGATLGSNVFVAGAAWDSPGPARQPSVAIAANRRIVDALDERISSSVYESNGKIYMVNTVNPVADGLDETRVQWQVLDASNFSLLAEGFLGSAGYDYYQGSIAVNSFGQAVIGYNRSGLDPATGKITFMASIFGTAAGGSLVQLGSELSLKESLTDDYHNGSVFGQASSGRQRWGDYSQVSVDPSNENQFYAIGQFAREYNLPQFGHPGGTGGSRWSTWVAVIDVSAVPEPSTWMMMLIGAAAVGRMALRRQPHAGATVTRA